MILKKIRYKLSSVTHPQTNFKEVKMKKTTIFYIITVVLLSLSFLSDGDKGFTSMNNVVVQCITTNLMGNNLYIDNISIGNRFYNDIAALSINNISKDTCYSIYGNNTFTLAPKISFLNEGRMNITAPFNVTLQITPGSYSSVKQIAVIDNHRALEVTFDSITLSPNTNYTLKAWSSLSNDQNPNNDTISQNTFYLPGARRNVLFEAYTNVSCPACGTSNPYLDTFIVSRFDTIVAIKYHAWWPAAGDPMYTSNPAQIRNRINYYPINNVPVLNVDGVYLNIYPYTNFLFLYTPYRTRLAAGSPISLSVVDTRLFGDTIQANTTLIIYSPLPQGNYRLRINAIERHIHYTNPPGSNGEKEFYDVFRRMYPDTNGIAIATSPGVYNYSLKYHRESNWVDSMIYTAVFVQNDNTKEVLNCAKSRNQVNIVNAGGKNKSLPFENVIQSTKQNNKLDSNSSFYLEPFETGILPAGWTITNTDNVNFSLSTIANGPSFGGTKSIVMLLMSASWTSPSYHYLKSRVYNNINLNDSIKFDWAYAPYGSENVEGLKVQVSTDGGNTFPYTIFNRTGMNLATAPVTGEAFVPRDSSQWGTFGIKIADLIGIKPISTRVPEKCQLFQNYPNPFNPTTKIKFDVAPPAIDNGEKQGMRNVTLKIYDILGHEVTVLVNEKLKEGTYEVEFDGSNYPSGVYFYKLISNEFTKTTKMVLLK